MNADLLRLPWEIQVALAGGYAAYVLAYTGLRARHQTIDVLLITLVFGLVATAVLGLTSSFNPIWRGVLAVCAAVLCGVFWRRFGRQHVTKLSRQLNVTWSDDAPSALASLSENTRYPVSQVAVQLDDGAWLECRDTSRFVGAPYAPCIIGPSGDIAFYLTHEVSPDGVVKELKTVRDADYGDRLTYVPANRIKKMTLRHQLSV